MIDAAPIWDESGTVGAGLKRDLGLCLNNLIYQCEFFAPWRCRNAQPPENPEALPRRSGSSPLRRIGLAERPALQQAYRNAMPPCSFDRHQAPAGTFRPMRVGRSHRHPRLSWPDRQRLAPCLEKLNGRVERKAEPTV